MPSALYSAPPVAELLEKIAWVNRHPSLRMDGVTTRIGEESGASRQEVFGTTTSSRNWKPFVIGILPPDYPIEYVPVMRVVREVPKACMPPVKPKPRAKPSTRAPLTEKKNTAFTRDAHREAILNAWKELLTILCAHSWVEMGAPGSSKIMATTNNNPGGIHSGKPAKEGGTVGHEIPGTGNNVLVEVVDPQTRQKVTAEYKPNGQPVNDVAKNNLSQVLNGKLWVADQGDVRNKDLYAGMSTGGDKYFALDTSEGVPYFTGFASYPTIEDGVKSMMRLLLTKYPGVKTATDTRSYAEALRNGVGKAKYFDDSNKGYNRTEHYISSIDRQREQYYIDSNWEHPPEPLKTQSQMTNPNQHIMAYGASTDKDDPLADAYGRNIVADTGRMAVIREETQQIQDAINKLMALPSLVMLVNPQEFRRSHENMVDFGVKVRTGNVVHTWFEQPIKINASGVSAAQYAIAADLSGGLTNYNRLHSLSYMNLMSLLLIYKNNGMVYGQSGTWDEGVIILPGAVYIYYDDRLYIGSFDSFGITDDATKPHNLTYNFSFTVRYDMDLDLGLDATMSMALQG
jgi:hypothetical protein